MDKQDAWANSSQSERPAPLVGIIYKLSNGERIRIAVPAPVEELLKQLDRQARSQNRKDRRHLSFVENVDELDPVHTQPQEDAAALVIRMDSYNRLYTAIDKLPELQRRRLLLYYYGGLTYRQIADLEGVSITAIGRAIERALFTLKKLLTV